MATVIVNNLQNFTGYSESFLYSLSQSQAADRDYMPSWFENKSTLRSLVDFANEAVSVGQDIFTAQKCLDAAGYMIENKQFYF